VNAQRQRRFMDELGFDWRLRRRGHRIDVACL